MRKRANQTLLAAEKESGYISALLYIVRDKHLVKRSDEFNINLIASIRFRAHIEKNWKFKLKAHAESMTADGDASFVIDEDDKKFVRDNLL